MSEEIPQDRCGYTWNPDHIEEEHENCCYRENWQDYDQCIWHANTENKPTEELQTQRETEDNRELNMGESESESGHFLTPAELLDGAILRNIDDFEDTVFKGCYLRDSEITNTEVSGMNFSGANLMRADMSDIFHYGSKKVEFRAANLEEVTLSNVSLSSADFSGSVLKQGDLTGAGLRSADLSNTNLNKTIAQDAMLGKADLSEATLVEADLRDAVLSNANISDAFLSNANLSGGVLDEADLSASNVQGANLSDTGLRGANLSNAWITGADFSDSLLMGATIVDSKGGSGDFSGAVLAERMEYSGAVLTGSELENTNFSNSKLSNVDFSQAKLDGSDFTNSNPENADFSEASVREGKFTQTELSHADFSNADVSESDFRDADLIDVSFHCTNLERAKLAGSDLFDADLSGAQLYGSRIGDVAVNIETVLDRHGDYRCVYDPNSEYEYDPDDEEKIGQLRKAMGAYHLLEQLTRVNTLPDEQAKFFVRRQDMRRAQLRQEGRKIDYWFAEAQNAIFRHGESFSRVVAWSVGTIVAFAFLYPLGGWLQSESTGTITYSSIAESPVLLWKTLHHSALLFLTGGGPLAPTGVTGEVLTTIEALIAPILLALLVFVLGRRAAR